MSIHEPKEAEAPCEIHDDDDDDDADDDADDDDDARDIDHYRYMHA